MPRPDDTTCASLVASPEGQVDREASAHPNPRRTEKFRRFNYTEYRNSIRDLPALDVDVAPLLPSDDANYGLDNVTVGNPSPTLLERYVSAARSVSRLAIGSPIKSPGGDAVNLPPDLTQEEHFEVPPLGTSEGLALRYTFPLDAEYEIQARLTRDRNEHVEGLSGAHEMELLVDGARVELFTVTLDALLKVMRAADDTPDPEIAP
jgi:hypothetical protein